MMTRLFLYLLALMAGFSPAQASRVAWAEPVAIGRLAQPVQSVARDVSVKGHVLAGFVHSTHADVAQDAQPFAGHAPHLTAAPAIYLTDRPQA